MIQQLALNKSLIKAGGKIITLICKTYSEFESSSVARVFSSQSANPG